MNSNSKYDILNDAASAIVKCNKAEAVAAMHRGLDAGIDPIELFMNGFGRGLHEVGEAFGKGRIFLPELTLAADAMKAISSMVDMIAQVPRFPSLPLETIIIATVEGDIHDIGKCLVVSVMRSEGLHVIDLGCDVPNDVIIRKALEYDASIIATSALLTTTILQQEKLEIALRERGLKGRFRTMVGGAPVTRRWAESIGADAYAANGQDAAQCALRLLTERMEKNG